MTSTETLTGAVPAASASELDAVPVERALDVVASLAADEFAGRRVGSNGGRAAAAWLIEQLRTQGARVGVEEFPVSGVRELYDTPAFEWTDAGGVYRGVHRRDFVEHLASADLPTPRAGTAESVDAADLHGRWVLAPAVTGEFVDRAVAAGAAGLLVPRGTDEAGWMPKMIAGPPVGPLPVIAIRTELHLQLAATAATHPVLVRASMALRVVDTVGTNVHGEFAPATPAGLRVLLTAHYDGVGDDPSVRLPAAADNASGCAVIFEAARILAETLPPGVGLAVAFLDAEEAGAHGSAHHARTVPGNTHVINVDGAAQLGEAAAVEAGGPAHALLAALDQAGRATGVPLRAGAMASDNRRYAAAGLPAIGIGMGVPGYQTPVETVDRVDPDTLVAAIRLVVATVQTLVAHHRTATDDL